MLQLLAWLLQPFNRATARRWLDIFLLGLTGSAICVAFSPVLGKVEEGSRWIVEYVWEHTDRFVGGKLQVFGRWPFALVVCTVVLFILTSLALALLMQAGALRWTHSRRMLLYPPVWLSGLWPVALLGGLSGLAHVAWDVPLFTCSLLLASVVVTSIVMWLLSGCPVWPLWRGRRRSDPDHFATKAETLALFAEDPEKMISWLRSPDPVCEPKDDLFEGHVVAQEIAELVTQLRLGPIGLIAPWGSGKTTVLNFVDYLLHRSPGFHRKYQERWRAGSGNPSWRVGLRPPWILTCRVAAWGFRKEPAAAVVLHQIVSELSKYVDCLALRSLPQEYLAALKGIAPSWFHGPLALVAGGSQLLDNPTRQLLRLDQLLEAINARLVVFIEDLDRNVEGAECKINQNLKIERNDAKSEFHNDLNSRPSGGMFLEVESLLDRMKKSTRVSFVLALSRNST